MQSKLSYFKLCSCLDNAAFEIAKSRITFVSRRIFIFMLMNKNT